MQVNQQRIRERTMARSEAVALVALLRDTIDGTPSHCRDILRAEVRTVLGPEPPRVVPDRPMTDNEIAAFENQAMDFGKHAGEQVKSVPLDYLLWLEEQPDFRRQLRRYLRNAKLQREQER